VSVAEGEFALVNRQGLHARPISRIVELARAHRARLTVGHRGRTADGRSVLELMTLGAGPGSVLQVRAEGEDAGALLAAVESLIAGGFGED